MLNEKNIELRNKLRGMKNVNYEYNEQGIADDDPEVVIWRIFIHSHYFLLFIYHINKEQHFLEFRLRGEVQSGNIVMDQCIKGIEEMVNELNS